MRNNVKHFVVAFVLLLMVPCLAKADDSVFTYKVANNYELTFTLKNADKVAIDTNSGIRYYRGENPSLDVNVVVNVTGVDHYYTIIYTHDQETGETRPGMGGMNSYSYNNFVKLPQFGTISVLIEYWKEGGNNMKKFDDVWKTYSIITNEFVIRYLEDTIAPVVTIRSGDEDINDDWYTNQSAVELFGSATDADAGVDEGTWTHKWGPSGIISGNRVVLPDEDFNRPLTFQVKDRVGNIGSKTVWVILDKTPPELKISGDTGIAWSADSPVVLEINASDALSGMESLEYSRDNGSRWTSLNVSQKNFNVTGEGKHTVIFKATDTIGNISTVSANVNIDTSPPDFQAQSKGYAYREDNFWVIPAYVFGAQDSMSGVDYGSLKYAVDGGAWNALDKAAWTMSPDADNERETNLFINHASLSGGNHTIKLSIADMAGNTLERSFNFLADTTPPIITGDSLLGDTTDSAPWTNQDRFAYDIAGAETGIGSYAIAINTVLPNGYVTAFSGYTDTASAFVFNSDAPDGTYQVVIRAVNGANAASSERIFYCRLDRTPPVINSDLIKSASRFVTINGSDAHSGLDPDTCWSSALSGVSEASGYTVELPEGAHEEEFTLKDIAGNSITQKVNIIIDQNPPAITVAAGEYGNNETLVVTIGISGGPMEITDVWYSLDGIKTELGEANWSSAAVPLGSCAEGIHSIRFGARNEVGLSGESAPHQFIIDRTPPELKGYELREAANPEHIIAEGEYMPEGAVLVKITAEDLYNNGADKKPGLIKYYSWVITRKLSDTPDFIALGKEFTEGEFIAQNFSEGLSYICVRAEDGAGNLSETLRIAVLQDQSSPGAPVIRSPTHAEASRTEQASPLSQADFTFIPAFGIKSGIKAYQWKLEKLYMLNNNPGNAAAFREGETAEIDQEGRSDLSLELGDNDENEFYQLLVRCVGGNDKASPWTSYRFRIDSEAPGDLIVRLVPRVDDSSWLNQWDALALWNKPRDMTGVAEYRHILVDEEETRTSPLEGRDTSSWNKTADTQLTVNLHNVLGAKRSGALKIGVSAVDYAGNSKFGQISFGYDFIPPRFNHNSLTISDTEDTFGIGKRIRWGGMKDEESGLDRVVILVSSEGSASAFTVEPELTEYVVSPLEENKVFTVVVRGYDRAGNQTELYDLCATGDATIPSVYFVPYLETINGYDISGKKRVEGGNISFTDLKLQIPEALELFSLDEGGESKTSLDKISLETTDAANGVFQTGRSGAGTYEMRSGGFILDASAILFSREGGLDLENAVYTRPLIVSGEKQERKISLGRVNAGNPPLMQFSSDGSAIGVTARMESVYIENSESQSGFTLTGIDSLFLSEGREWFGGSDISFDRGPLTNMAIDIQGEIRLRNSAVEAHSSNLAALLDISSGEPLGLAMGGAQYRIVRAGIQRDLLDIYEAILPLPPGYDPPELTVRNITIDTRTGSVREGPDFSAGTFAVTIPGGMTFEAATIRLDSQGKLLVTGAVNLEAYGTYRVEDIVLSDTGIDWESGAEITGFTAEIHGFLLSAQKAQVTASGIFIGEGSINVWGNRQGLVGLGLRSDTKDGVWQEGIIEGTFYEDPGYGCEIRLSKGKVADDGVFAEAVIPLGEGVTDAAGAVHWILPQARLYPDFSMTGSFAGERNLVVADAAIRVEECFFDGQMLRIGKARIDHIPNLSPETLVFTGIGITYQGVSVEGVLEENYLFSASGWQISYASLGFDGQGIKGRASLRLPEKLGGTALVFPESRITTDGLFSSGNPDESWEILRFQNLPVFADGVGLLESGGVYVLELAFPRLSLKAINGPDILFGKTIFDSEGKTLLGNGESKKTDFTSFNGYRIGLENARIDDLGFSLEGTLSLELFDRTVTIPGGTYRILPDLSVIGTGPEAGLNYNFGDWSIKGENIVFEAERMRIGSNRVLFREIEFDIGEIPFSPEGRFLQTVTQKQDIGVSLFGAGARISETRFSEAGIEARVAIALPPVLGGKSFAFDNVGFRADGSFWIEKTVNSFSFAALGFSFDMEELTLDSLGLQAAKASITLPESMEAVVFKVQDLRIGANGDVGIGNTEISPFTLWNIGFTLNSFSIINGEASFQGGVILPPTIPGELSGRELHIRDFRAGLAGGITAMDICLEGDYSVPFGEAWNLSFRNVRINYAESQPWISADRVELLFPEEYEAKNGYVDQAKFNPLNGQFVFSEIAFTSDIFMNFWGLEFTLNKLKIDSQFSIEFGGSARFPDTNLPAFLAGKTVVFNRFEIKSDGTLGEVNVKLEDLEGGVIPNFDGLVLKKGSVSLLKQGNKSLILDIKGNITLGNSMPAGLTGTALKIETFTYDTAAREIRRLKATTVLPVANFLENSFSKLSIGVDWNEAKQTGFLNLAGNLKFPGSFPAFLAGKEAKISSFKIGFDGVIQSFAAKYATEKKKAYDAFGFLQLSDVVIEASLKSEVMKFDLEGIVILPEAKFPQGIGGLRSAIAMEFDTLSGLKTASALTTLPDSRLLGSMDLRGGTIGITKKEGSALEISVGGDIVLPEFFPEGLRGIVLGIRTLTINCSGEILDVDIGASGIGAKIFGMAELINGSLVFKKGGANEFLIDIGGAVRLTAAGLPEGLKNATVKIRTLELSTLDGLRSFDAGVEGELAFSILGGIRIAVSSLDLSETGISLAASAKLPSNYPNGLAGVQFVLASLKLGWNGALLDIRGGLKSWSMTLAGFTAVIDELYFDKDTAGRFQAALKSCKIEIPEYLGSLGGQHIAIKNAKFSSDNGSFLGDVELAKLETEIAGFRLIMDKPSLSFSESLINFSKVTLKLPEFFGKGEVALKKVTLSAKSGIQVSGGAFKLPSFNMGLFSFNNVKVDFSMSGSQYALEGSGSVIIPGAGNISAALGFTTKSETYPIGLKRAEFSYVLNVGGIPLGTTGLYIKGITGGVSYGPPSEVPSLVRGLFNGTGPRMKVGLTLSDSTGGSILSMSPVTWVDISNGSWAFEGSAAVLKGSLNISADITAGLGSKGFSGQFDVDIRFARGGVTVYVFDKAGSAIMSGEGYVQFGIPKGFIIDTWLLKVPSSALWIAKVNAAFGRFTNGKTGIKGTINLPVLGTKGVFVGSGGLDIGSLSSYAIEKPKWLKNIRFFSDDNIDSHDSGDSSGDDDVLYQFFVPPKGAAITAPFSLLQEEYEENTTIPESGLDRLIIVLEYPEGAPELTVISPLGLEYREGSNGCETIVEENGLVLVVYSAEAGIWQARVRGLEEEAYRLSALGNMAAPLLELEEPLSDSTTAKTQKEIRVRGRIEKGRTSVRIFAQESEGPGFDLGSYDVDPEGRFDLAVSLWDLQDGEYSIYAEFEGPGSELCPPAYAPGKILLDRSDLPMLAPLLRVAETDPGTLSLHWQNTNGGRSAGYKISIQDHREGTESIVYVGSISALDLPGYADEQELSFAVAALDEAGNAGPWAAPVSIQTGLERPLVNRPVAELSRVEAKGVSSGFIGGLIRADIANFQERSDSSGYVGIRYTGSVPEQFLNLHFSPPVQVSEQGVEIPWSMGIDESAGPGLYEYPCEFFNEANGTLNSPFVLAVELSWPEPKVAWTDPGEISGIEETIIDIHGHGFVPGTRVFWQNQELAVLESDSGSMLVKAPPLFDASEAQRRDTEQGELVVLGPGGDKTVFPVTVLLPSYNLSIFTRIAETSPGGRADYAIAVESLNGFEGKISFRALEKPEAMEIILPEFTLKDGAAAGTIVIQTRKDILPGSYVVPIEGDGGKLFELVVTVLSGQPLPALSSLIPRAAYAGDTVHVYGNNFGNEGKLFVNDRETPVSSWSREEIVFVVPENALSGAVHIVSAGEKSNALSFTVRERGFEIHPSTVVLELSAGEEKTLPLVLTGYEDMVSLSLAAEPGAPLTATLSRTILKPGEPLGLTVKADPFGIANAGNGSWTLVVHGESRGFEADVEALVVIGDSLRISTGRLPDALVDTGYHAELESQNARGALTYRLARGSLPPGLSMSAHGVISGRPLERGRYEMDIEARDSQGWRDRRSFTITVWEESWSQAGKDGGNSGSVGTDLSATGNRAWSYQGRGPVAQILAAEDRIIALGAGELFALNAGNGALSWTVRGNYRTILFAGAKLYALAEGGRLEVRNPLNGALLWSRENIEGISSDGATVFEETATRRFFRNAERGTLIEEQRKDGSFPSLWHYGSAYLLQGSALIPLYGPGAAWDAGEGILAVAADIRGGAALTENFIILFDRDMNETARMAAAHSPTATLSLTEGGVSVLDRGYLRSYDREDLRLQWSRGTDGGFLIGNGLEKTVLAGSAGLAVLNRYDGNVIWRDEKPYSSFALYHGRIVAADGDGAITVFDGPPNVGGPVTELRIDPPSPGESLWHTQKPLVTISAADRETYVEQILMRRNGGLWEGAPVSFVPEDGEHHIVVYGVDSRGLAGPETRLQFRVDTGLPESDIEIEPEEPESGWHNRPVRLAINAWDEVSGVDWIRASLSAYTAPILLSEQGTHSFSWQALDRAGNEEPLREVIIRIDLEPPLAEVSVLYDEGMAELTLAASDKLSGPAFIEYRIDGAAAERYGEPLFFVEPGAYRVDYRAFDRAGNHGEWQSCDVFVAPDNTAAALIDTPLVNGRPRKVMGRARRGMPLLAADGETEPKAGDPGAMAALPSYVLGAEYLGWDGEDVLLDETASLSFRLKRNAVVYLFLPSAIPAPRGWSLVEDGVGINRLYYPGGAAVYMRRYPQGALAEIPGTPAGAAPPLVMAQEKGDLTANISIRREEGALFLGALAQPRQHGRRLPLLRRWFVNAGDGWETLEGNRYEEPLPVETPEPSGETVTAPLRFRLELYTPDGQVELRVEKVFDPEEDPEEGL